MHLLSEHTLPLNLCLFKSSSKKDFRISWHVYKIPYRSSNKNLKHNEVGKKISGYHDVYIKSYIEVQTKI